VEIDGREVSDLTRGLESKEVRPHASVAVPSVTVKLAALERGFVAVARLQTGTEARSAMTRPDPARVAEVEEHNRKIGT